MPPKKRSAGRARRIGTSKPETAAPPPPASTPPPAPAAAAPGAPAFPPPAAPAIGRPSTLTPAIAGAILDAIELGVTAVGAAHAAGVPVPTLKSWLRHGRRDVAAGHATAFASLASGYTRAKGASERSLVATIRGASVGDGKRPGDWRAAAFLLERRHHQRWSRREQVRAEVTGHKGAPLVPVEGAVAVLEEGLRRAREAVGGGGKGSPK